MNNPKIIIAIDFDLTICQSDYPAVGEPIKDAIKTINLFYDKGYGIIINTCREGHALSIALSWLDKHGVKYHYCNCNFPHIIEKYKADTRKISADMYIDDRGLEPLPEWKKIYEIVCRKFFYDTISC